MLRPDDISYDNLMGLQTVCHMRKYAKHVAATKQAHLLAVTAKLHRLIASHILLAQI
jgi:hypothetical protein